MGSKKTLLRWGSYFVLAWAGALFFAPTPAWSQEVQGVVIDRQTGERVRGASVMLLDTTFFAVAGTSTNNNGAFSLESPRPGSFFVLTESLGYRPTMDGILDMDEGGFVSVEIYLDPKPIELDSLKIAVERVTTYQVLETAGFHERVQTGFGHFITPEEIRRRNPRYMYDLLRNTPGVRVVGAGMDNTQIEFTNVVNAGSATCSPSVYVDGMLANTEFGGLESVVSVDQIAGVEVYTRASSVPIQWGGLGSACGVLLIWTR